MKSIAEHIQQGDRFFRWRGGATSRLEALFDVILALALTLTAISAEVPQNFQDLVQAFAKLPAFAVCFAILLMCWYYHFLFHRRYGIENFPLVVMSGVLLFVIISYVYPLKFIYSALLDPAAQVDLTPLEGRWLIGIYSGGFTAIFLMFLLMNGYAYACRRELELNANEQVLTCMTIGTHAIYVLLGALSVLLAWAGVGGTLAGWVYVAIGPLQFANGLYWGLRIDASPPPELPTGKSP
jgi:hypothetical protein